MNRVAAILLVSAVFLLGVSLMMRVFDAIFGGAS